MRLRHRADVRTLVWAFLLFPSVPLVAYVQPELAPWLLPVALYLAYCAGVLTHNHNHGPVFESRSVNRAYGAWLSFFYGFPIFGWIPTHNQNHHRHVNGPGDATRTTRLSERDTLVHALVYPTLSTVWQMPGIWAFVRSARTERPERFREIVLQCVAVVGGHVGMLALAIHLHSLETGLWTYGLAVGISAASAGWSMMFTNYLQHVGCDWRSSDDHSRNFVSPFANLFVFNAGFHTVHHELPGAHWSRLPALHAARAAAMDPRLNERTIFGFLFKRYVLGRPLPALRPAAQEA